MALMYPWATKEYLLHNMSLGQIIMYHNLGVRQLNKTEKDKKDTLVGKSYEELAQIKKEMQDEGCIAPSHTTEALKKQYGDIEDGK
jgi:hypothetical protein